MPWALALGSWLAMNVSAQAHPGHPGANGFADGLVHPLYGLDHLLVMIAVGLWAGQRGGRALWLIPTAFLGTMALGVALGWTGVSLPLMETGIVASGIILGLLVATACRWSLLASSALVGLFGLFHGYAHGAELLRVTSPWLCGAGLLLTTALLHLIGMGMALATRMANPRGLRYAGAAVILAAVWIWLAP